MESNLVFRFPRTELLRGIYAEFVQSVNGLIELPVVERASLGVGVVPFGDDHLITIGSTYFSAARAYQFP